MPTLSATLRNSLRQVLPPPVFEQARMGWWRTSTYFPRLVTSRFVIRPPEVQSFGRRGGASDLAKRLRLVNTAAPTSMCVAMTKHGSDKGQKRHNYTTVYSALFSEYRERPLRIFELGLGTNNPEINSSMGPTGHPGASLRGWRDFFPKAKVFGADIDHRILFESDRIKTFHCDQLDQSSISRLWSQPDLQEGMDIIIEDGLHTFEANVSFLEGSLNRLGPGGVYVVEDIDNESMTRWRERLETVYAKSYPALEFALVALPNALNHEDNNLLIIRRNTD